MRKQLSGGFAWLVIFAATITASLREADAAIHASVECQAGGSQVGEIDRRYDRQSGEFAAATYAVGTGGTASAHSGLPAGDIAPLMSMGVSAYGSSFGYGSAGASWADGVTMRSMNGVPLPSTITFEFALFGHFFAVLTPDGDGNWDQFASADLRLDMYALHPTEARLAGSFQAASGIFHTGRDSTAPDFGINLDRVSFRGPGFEPHTSEYFGTVAFTMSLDEARSYQFSMGARASARWGYAEAMFGDTAILTAILLEDGSTPESQGYSLEFDSGMNSPNLIQAEVPEPATLTIWGLGALGCAFAAYRRKRLAA